MRNRCRRFCSACLAVGLSLSVAAALAQQTPIAELTRNDDALGLPSFGRVLAAFIVVAGIAVGVGFALRRLQPRWNTKLAGAQSIRVIERGSVGATRVYLLEVDACKVLLTEHRSGTSMIVLSRATPVGSPQP
jgi:flagellar biogenesis protein FliO